MSWGNSKWTRVELRVPGLNGRLSLDFWCLRDANFEEIDKRRHVYGLEFLSKELFINEIKLELRRHTGSKRQFLEWKYTDCSINKKIPGTLVSRESDPAVFMDIKEHVTLDFLNHLGKIHLIYWIALHISCYRPFAPFILGLFSISFNKIMHWPHCAEFSRNWFKNYCHVFRYMVFTIVRW